MDPLWTSKQIEHWVKIGEILEDNPDLPYEFAKQAITDKAEQDASKLVLQRYLTLLKYCKLPVLKNTNQIRNAMLFY